MSKSRAKRSALRLKRDEPTDRVAFASLRGQILRQPMAYLPVYCGACARASLSTKSANDPQLCSFCEGPARVVPGPIYGDGDWLAFAEIDDAIFEAGLAGGQASSLAEELQQLLSHQSPTDALVQRMIQRVPSLAKCRPALVNGPQRGLRMLTTLLVARSRDQPLTAADVRLATPNN